MKNDRGHGKDAKYAVGDFVIRTRHKRGGEQRAWVKVSEPNSWRLRAHVVWESVNGTIPDGMVVHHKDRNKLNDSIDNLCLITKADHLKEHRPEFIEKAIAAFVKQRRVIRWTTKSKTKRCGRHPKNCNCPIHCVSDNPDF